MKKNLYYPILLLLLTSCSHDLLAQENSPSKKITTEFACNDHPTVFLENTMRRMTIFTWNENKIKLEANVFYQGNPELTDQQWLDRLALGISGDAANVVVKSVNLRQTDKSAGVVLYIPAGAKLDIESKYAEISLNNNIKEVKLQVSNGGFDMQNAEKLVATVAYGGIRCNNVGVAQVEITNSGLTVINTGTADIHSKNSQIALRTVKTLKMVSEGDNIDIDSCHTIGGKKDYGDLRITTLSGALDIGGVNADIKVRRIDPATHLVKITNQYANLGLPLGNLKNYQVNFEGEGGNVYSPFEKSRQADNSFKASAGNISGPSTLFQLKCNNCMVDFK